MMLGVGFSKEDGNSLSILRWVSLIVMSVKACYSFIFVVIVIFVNDTSLNPFW